MQLVNADLRDFRLKYAIEPIQEEQDTRTLGAIQEQLAGVGPILPPISRSTPFVDASEERMPLAVYQPKHPAIAILEIIASSMESLK